MLKIASLVPVLQHARVIEVGKGVLWMRFAVGVVLLCTVAWLGCGNRLPEVATVSGRVTIDGKPVIAGTVQFWPAAGRPARGSIGPDGRYTLSTFFQDDGAVLGPHKVTIEATRVHYNGPRVKSMEEEFEYFSKKEAPPLRKPVIERLVPQRYSERESSTLTAEVGPGDNSIDFNLSAKR